MLSEVGKLGGQLPAISTVHGVELKFFRNPPSGKYRKAQGGSVSEVESVGRKPLSCDAFAWFRVSYERLEMVPLR